MRARSTHWQVSACARTPFHQHINWNISPACSANENYILKEHNTRGERERRTLAYSLVRRTWFLFRGKNSPRKNTMQATIMAGARILHTKYHCEWRAHFWCGCYCYYYCCFALFSSLISEFVSMVFNILVLPCRCGSFERHKWNYWNNWKVVTKIPSQTNAVSVFSRCTLNWMCWKYRCRRRHSWRKTILALLMRVNSQVCLAVCLL